MDTNLLHSFLAVQRARNFTLAAQELHLAQSTVTTHVQVLERILGTRLFDRLAIGTVCTPAGERLVDYAQNMIDLEETMKNVIGRGDGLLVEGAVHVAAPDTLSPHRIPTLMGRLRSQYPGIQLSVCSIGTDKAVEGLRDGTVDIAVVIEPTLSLRDITTHRADALALTFITPPTMIGDLGGEWGDLTASHFLCLEEGCSYSDAIAIQLAAAGHPAAARSRFYNVETIKNCVRSGYGISVLPYETIAHDVRQGLIGVADGPDLPEVFVQVLTSSTRTPTPAIARVLREICELESGDTSGDEASKVSDDEPASLRSDTASHLSVVG